MTARGCLWHRRSPLKRSTGRPSRQPVEPELQKETDGRIDRSEVRDTPWDPLARKGRWFVWNSRRGNHLGQRSTKPHQQAGHMDASDPIRPSKTLAARGPSTYGSRIGARYPRLSGTTWIELSQSNSVIASQRVGAKRRPMTGSAKQSTTSPPQSRKMDCFVALLLATTAETHLRDPAARLRPDCARNSSRLDKRGRRESRVPSAPAASRAK